MAWTLALSAVTTLAAGLLFVRVGLGLRTRATASEGDRRAMRAFAAWWVGVGGSTLAVSGMLFAGVAERPSPMLVASLRILSLALLSVGLAGLLSHVLYVRTGRDHTRLIGGAYLVLTALVVGQVLWTQPAAVDVTAWTVEARGARPAHPAVVPVLVFAYLLPPVVAGALYLGLRDRASDEAQRRRITILGGGIAVWTAATLLARASDADLWQFVTRDLLGIGVATLFARAYAPPREQRERDEAALRERARQLV